MSFFNKLFGKENVSQPPLQQEVPDSEKQHVVLDLTKQSPLNLSKNTILDLSKAPTVLENVRLGAGWDPVTYGRNIDLDLFALLLDNGSHQHTVYFGNKRHQGLYLDGDNLTGDGDGDDENIFIKLNQLPSNINEVIIGVHSYSGQTFDQVKNAYVRLVTDRELARFTLSENGAGKTSVKFARFKKVNNQWSFETLGQLGKHRSIGQIAKEYN